MYQKRVILHTDIGGDIDDFWALVMLLRQSAWLKLEMILTDTWNAVARAAVCEKILAGTGFEQTVLIGAGIQDDDREITHGEWIRGYDMSRYPGRFRKDGVAAMIELIEASPEPVTLISIGPATSLAEALRIAPGIAGKVHFVGMFGSINRRYDGGTGAEFEFNVKQDIPACRKIFTTPWLSFVNTPLDTCAAVVLEGEFFRRITESDDPLLRKLMECNACFLKYQAGGKDVPAPRRTTLLCDTVAIHLASSRRFLHMENLKLRVTDQGLTIRDDISGTPGDTALSWTDPEGFKRLLTDTLTARNSDNRTQERE